MHNPPEVLRASHLYHLSDVSRRQRSSKRLFSRLTGESQTSGLDMHVYMATSRVDVTTEKALTAALLESKRFEKTGHLEKALDKLERLLPETENPNNPSSLRLIKRIATLCNRLTTSSHSQRSVVRYLRTAEQVLAIAQTRAKSDNQLLNEGCFRLTVLTFNNWATYHKEKRSYHMALSYLLRAGKMIEGMGEVLNPDTLELCAKTKLNIAALYSELRRYPEAVEFAEQCLATLQLELNLRLTGRRFEDLHGKDKLKFDNMIGTYVVAFYNIGVAEESQSHGSNAIEAYRNAVSIGKRFLSTEHAVLKLAERALKETPVDMNTARTDVRPVHKVPSRDVMGDPLREAQLPTEEVPIIPISDASGHFSADLSAVQGEQSHDDPDSSLHEIYKEEEFKYYTPEQLGKLQQRLAKGTGLNFVSADKYFYTKITKTLNVSKDVKFLRPLSA